MIRLSRPETESSDNAKPEIVKEPLSPDAIAQMISDYEEELAKVTNNADGLDKDEDSVDAEIDELQARIRAMEGRLNTTSKQRRDTYETYSRLVARNNEIVELFDRFRLLDLQYTNDLKRLAAIQQSGQFFVLREPMPCPLCGAPAEGQRHDAACDGNVEAVTQAAAAEISKLSFCGANCRKQSVLLPQRMPALSNKRNSWAPKLKSYQQQIDNALSPDFAQAPRAIRKTDY